jgi:hypothetical protein
MVFISGLTDAGSKVNGRTTICMAEAFIIGLMVGFMKANILMIRNMAKVFTLGVMADNTVVNGQTASSTDRVSTDMLMGTVVQEYGMKANGRYGLMNND